MRTSLPKVRVNKWFILMLVNMVTFGGYYAFDFPSVLHNQLYRHFLPTHSFASRADFELEFSLLFSVYSMPNTVLPYVGGKLSDTIGNSKVMLWTAVLVLVGNLLQTYAVLFPNMNMLILGRLIFGFGAETLQVCCNTVIAKWFNGQELALALGINLSVCKLGGVLTDWLSPYIEDNYNIQTSSVVVSLLCLFCFMLTILLLTYDSNEGDQYRNIDQNDGLYDNDSNNRIVITGNYGIEEGSYRDGYPNRTPIPRYQQIEMAKLDNSSDERSPLVTSNKGDGEPYVNASFPSSVWLLFAMTFVMYGIFIPFNNLSNAIILEIYYSKSKNLRQSEIIAARLQSIPYFLSVFLSPFLGLFVDYYGHRTIQLVFSALSLAFAHEILFHGSTSPILPLLLIGLSYSVFGSVSWPCIPLIVKEEKQGTAYGLMAAFQNSGQFVIPLILQEVFRESNKFISCELFLIYFACFGVFLATVLYVVDWYWHDSILHRSS